MYFFVKNLQGDILKVVDYLGNDIVTYEYDPWGKVINEEIAPGKQLIAERNIFRYRGYIYDSETELYYLQSRYYDPHIGRFINADSQFNLDDSIMGGNLFAYCYNNPIIIWDPTGLRGESIWSFKNDSYGRQILTHYLYGRGQDFVKFRGGWEGYMKANELLKFKIQLMLIPIGKTLSVGSSIPIDFTLRMVIENGEDIIGYQYLHGTNETVGDFRVIGKITKYEFGFQINCIYIWNDIIDPNFIYESDSIKAAFAKKIPFANPTDYTIKLIWGDQSFISFNYPELNYGWLSGNYDFSYERTRSLIGK